MFFNRHMTLDRTLRLGAAAGLCLMLAACGGGGNGFGGGLFSRQVRDNPAVPQERVDADAENATQSSFFDLFENLDDPNTTVEVNKYLWKASLEVLNFLPVESVDPFSGVIDMGYGTPPGGGRSYRATIYIQDPALEARSLKVALQSRGGGAVGAETTRAVEDAILTRARQLRIVDARL